MDRISEKRAKNCVTHHYACDCREWQREKMEEALLMIELMAEQALTGAFNEREMCRGIAARAHSALIHLEVNKDG